MGNFLKVKHKNVLPKIIQYRDYINFDSTRFFEKLQVMFFNLNMNILNFGSLKKCFLELLLLKRKFPRANHSEFVTKEVIKTMMLRTKLRNQFLKKRSLEVRTRYNNQKNIVSAL